MAVRGWKMVKGLVRDFVRMLLILLAVNITCGVLIPFTPLIVLLWTFWRPAKETTTVVDGGTGTVFITGGSAGIGEEIAMEYARRGWRVVITGRNATRLESVKEACIRLGAREVISKVVDVTDKEAMTTLVDQIWKSAPIDVVYANAGVNACHTDKTLDGLDRTTQLLQINFMGTIYTVHPVLRRMLQRKSGHVVIISSYLAHCRLPFACSYQTSKAAQLHYAESLSEMLRYQGIEMTCVTPGWVLTNMTREVLSSISSMHDVWTASKAARFIVSEVERGATVVGFSFFSEVVVLTIQALPAIVRGLIGRAYLASLDPKHRANLFEYNTLTSSTPSIEKS